MKKILTLIAAFSLGIAAFADEPQFVYTNALDLTVGGKVCEKTFEPFSRLPESLKDVSRPAVWGLGRNSAGVYVKFASDAGGFSLKWTPTFFKTMQNMAPIGTRGLALYVYDKGEWVYVGAPKVGMDPSKRVQEYFLSCDKLEGQMREYLVYMGLYVGFLKFEIGVKPGKTIKPSEFNSPKAEKPVIIYGTSILQGASASHPGLAGTNILSRMLDREVINLGFSGNALLDYDIAELMASYPDPGVYVMDNIPNGSAKLTHEKLAGFIKIIRDAHPTTPIVFVEGPIYPGARFDTGRERFCVDKNIALHEEYDKFKKAGMKNIYMITSEKMLTDNNIGTIEGTHFTDIGFTQWAECVYPTLRKLCKKL